MKFVASFSDYYDPDRIVGHRVYDFWLWVRFTSGLDGVVLVGCGVSLTSGLNEGGFRLYGAFQAP